MSDPSGFLEAEEGHSQSEHHPPACGSPRVVCPDSLGCAPLPGHPDRVTKFQHGVEKGHAWSNKRAKELYPKGGTETIQLVPADSKSV